MDADLVPIRAGDPFARGASPSAVRYDFVTHSGAFSRGSFNRVAPPASEFSVMRAHMVTQMAPANELRARKLAARAMVRRGMAGLGEATASGPTPSRALLAAGLVALALVIFRKAR